MNGIKISEYKRGQPMFTAKSVMSTVAIKVKNEQYFKGRSKTMIDDLNEAEKKINEYTIILQKSLDRLEKKEIELSNLTKTVSSKVRDSTNKLGNAMSKVETLSNFDKLKDIAITLDRIEKTITTLAELEKSGKLDKVVLALRG